MMINIAYSKDNDMIKIQSGEVITSSNDKKQIGSGWYMTEMKAKSSATGARKMKSSLNRVTKERDAYKTAYEKSSENNEKYSKLLQSMYDEYDRRKAETDKMISNYNQQIALLEKKNKQLKSKANAYKRASIILLIVGGIAICK